RFRRIKHYAGFPVESIRYCLRAGGIELSNLDHVAVNRDPAANRWRKVGFTLRKRPDVRLVLDRLRRAREWSTIEKQLERMDQAQIFGGEVHHVEHHLSHLGSAFLV